MLMLRRLPSAISKGVAIGRNGILVIDDDRMVQDAVRQVLELEGYAITCASDGREALTNSGPEGLLL